MKRTLDGQARNGEETTVPLVSKPKGKMGRRLESLDSPLPPGLRGEFCKTIRRFVKDRGIAEISNSTGLSPTFLRQVVAGKKVPDMDRWPELAKRLGLSHWTELFDVKRSAKKSA